MQKWKDFFKGKRVTVMGLGLLGRGLGDAIFLAEHGAELIVTDFRDKKALAPSLAKLKKYKDIKYTLGQHKLEDFSAKGGQAPPDFILKAAGVLLDSPYIAEARKHKIPIEMDASLFAKLAPKGITIVGVTGTRGKSTVTAIIYDILSSPPPRLRRGAGGGVVGSIYKGGNLVPEATLPLLEKVKSGDIVVLELDSWQLQGFHDAKISPQVAVFTTFLDDHLAYYKGDRKRYFEDKAAVFKYQKKGDVLIFGAQAVRMLRKGQSFVTKDCPLRNTTVVARAADIPADWKIPLLGEHNLENIACAIAVAKHFKIPESAIRKAVENFKPVPGRLEFIREVKGIKIYNDNNATTPDATIAGLRALSSPPRLRRGVTTESRDGVVGSENIILIMGGTDKGLDMSKLVAEIPKHCKAVILLKESGTAKFLTLIHNSKFIIQEIVEAENLKECVEKSMELAECGDTVLFSPAFASFGKWFKNEYDRGEQFVKMVESL